MKIDIVKLIEDHDAKMDLLEDIKYWQGIKKCKLESIEGFGGLFIELKNKYLKEIDDIDHLMKSIYRRYRNEKN